MTRLDRLQFVVFGDQSIDSCSALSLLISQGGGCKEEKQFLKDVVKVVQNEIIKTESRTSSISQRPDHIYEQLTACQTLDELIRCYMKRDDCVSNAAFDSCLSCISQVIQIFRYFALDRSETKDEDTSTNIIGLCTGGLAAAVFSCARSIEDVARLALPAIRIAFRIGLYAGSVSDSIEYCPIEGSQRHSWSISFTDFSVKQAEDLVQKVHDSIAEKFEEIPLSTRCYITAVTQTGVTISGTPHALEYLLSFGKDHLHNRSKLKLPIYAAYHVPRLYEDLDLEWLLTARDDETRTVLQDTLVCRNQLCATTGLSFQVETAWELFTAVIKDILMTPLRWDKIVTSSTQLARESSSTLVYLTSIGAMGASRSLASAFKTALPGIQILESDIVSSSTLQNESKSREPIQEPLAIVGIAGRFPGAANHEELWGLLMKGLDMHEEIPVDRFDKSLHVDPTGKKTNTSWTPYGCFVGNPGFFDPAFFHISPREALQTDPMQRLALVTAYEALEMAGYTPDRTPSTRRERIGTFYGQTSDDYREVNASQKVDTYFIPGGIRAFGPGRINYHFKFSGPSFNVDTACSSSFAALQLACTSVWAGDCDTAVVGGLSILTSPDLFSGLSRGQFLSKTGSCKTFDDGADGYCRADAVASIVIKRLSDARKDNDKILATIASMRTNHSAEAISITHPHANTQMKLYRQILSDAGIHPHDVRLVEMHGTGTQAGDSIEMESVSEVFANTYNPRTASNPLFVGSVKANIGHGEAASGVTALIKSIMMLQKKTLPPHVGIKGTINQKFPDLNARNIKIATKATLLGDNEPLNMMINNFSAAGGNTAMILKAYQEVSETTASPEFSPQVVALSGHTFTSLKNNVSRLLAFLQDQPDTNVRHLSYTTTARRMHYKFRMTLTVASTAELMSGLMQWLDRTNEQFSKTIPRRLVVVFTGQGATYTDIGRRIFQAWPQARSELKNLDKIVKENSFPSIMDFLEADEQNKLELTPTQTQLGVLCIQITLCSLWTSLGIKPDAVIGHSLGEYAAMVAAGILSAADAVYLVGHRASLLEKHCKKGSHCMLVLKASETAVNELAKISNVSFEIACLNAHDQIVVSGTIDQIDALAEICQANKIKTTKLTAPYAFHSSQIDSILTDFGRVADRVVYKKPAVTYLSALHGRALLETEVIDARYICNHARHSVKFMNCLDTAVREGILDQNTAFLEIGVHPLCTPMIRSIVGAQCTTISTMENKHELEQTVALAASKLHQIGIGLNWNQYQQFFNTESRLLHLPSYAFDNKDYWIPYKNNWCLTKNLEPENTPRKEANISQAFISSSVHKLVESDLKSTKPFAVFESNLAHKELHETLTGHLVNGAGLCSSAVYADIAMTVADHLRKDLAIKVDGISVRSMEITSPLNIRLERAMETRTLRLYAALDKSLTKLTLEYFTYEDNAHSQTKHAHCVVEYGDVEQWKVEWNRINYLLTERIDHVASKATRGEAHKILKPMAYKLFSSLVDYSPRFQNMQVVSFDCPAHEAVASVKLSKQQFGESFRISPYWIDSLVHLAGLVMNGNDQDDPSVVYISHGWENMSFAILPQHDQDYTCYVKMQPVSPKVYAGDVWILQNGMVVGVCKALKFQRITRSLLNTLLPPLVKTTVTQTVATAPPSKRIPKGVDFEEAVKRLAETNQRHKDKPPVSEASIIKKIIADEVGVASVDEDSLLEELGIDSLLTLTIVDRIREETNANISSHLFLQCLTVKDVLGQHEVDETEISSSYSSGSRSPLSYGALSERLETGVTTPGFESANYFASTDSKPVGDGSDAIHTIIAEELGFDLAEIHNDSDLIALGMDSLMMLSIQSRLQEHLRRPVPPGLFNDYTTVQDIRAKLYQSQSPPQHRSVLQTMPKSVSLIIHEPQTRGQCRTLFLFPDGSGNPASYANIPSSALASVRIIALSSPFLHDSSRYTVSLEDCVGIYLDEIRKRQPTGPYSLGGWSIGGVFAFEACQQLQRIGEKVEHLLLIDSPCPTVQEPMPQALITYLEGVGVFGAASKRQGGQKQGSQTTRQQLLAHFEASVKCLEQYHANPLPDSSNLVTHVFEANHGVYEKAAEVLPHPPVELEGSNCAQWILYNREVGAGLREWRRLLGNTRAKEIRLDGNHFSIMRKPNASELERAIEQALE